MGQEYGAWVWILAAIIDRIVTPQLAQRALQCIPGLSRLRLAY